MGTSRAPRRISIALIALAVLMVTAAPAVAKPKNTTSDPLITGLAGPLGLAVGDDGTIYVSEAFAGKLTAIDKRGAVKVLIDAAGTEVAGIDAKGKGTLVFTQTLFDGEPGEEAPPLDALLVRIQPNGKTRTIASTEKYEIHKNPDQVNTYGLESPSEACVAQWPAEFGPPSYTGIVESHPYAVAIVPGGYVVADAAANAIFSVKANGRISTLAVLPPIAQKITEDVAAGVLESEGFDISKCVGTNYLGEPVPTDIEVGPDGYYYVSTLPGGPELPGAGAVWKINPKSAAISLVTDGLSGPVDIAVASDGTIWVAELFGYQISTITNGVPTHFMFADSPGAIEIGSDGSIYAAVGVFSGEGGSVIRINP